MSEVIIHDEDSGYAKEINKIFPLSDVIRKLNTWPKEDRIHWRDILLVTILHNTSKTQEETLESLKKIEEAMRRLKK